MAFMHVPVSLAADCTMGFLRHDAIQPAAPSPILMPSQYSIEGFVHQAWPGGLAFNNHEFTTDVFHYGMPVALGKHDCGPLTFDITPTCPANLNYPVMWPKASRTFVWTTTSVEHNGKKVGCAALLPTLPMKTCGDPISGPLAMLNTNVLNSEKVGLSLGDLLVGAGKLAVSMGIDMIFAKIGGSESKAIENLGEHYAKEYVKSWVMPLDGNGWAKWGANQLAGIVTSVVDTDADGNVELRWPDASISLGKFSGGYDFHEGEGKGKVSLGVAELDVASGEAQAFGQKL